MLGLFLAAPVRAAEPTPGDAGVGGLVQTGLEAARAKEWQACIDALSAALKVEASPRTAGELGLCEEQAGNLAAAHRHLLQARQAAPAADREKEPFAGYQRALARVTERVAVVFVSARPTDARVLLDGQPLGVADGTHVAVEPGRHVFTARREGYEDAREEHVFKAGSIPHVHLVLGARPQAAELPAAAPQASPKCGAPVIAPAPSVAPASPAPWYTPGWSAPGVLVTLAYASAATAIVSGATAIGLDTYRSSMLGGVPRDACGPDAPSRLALCDRLAERYEQQNVALGVAVGSGVAAGLFAGAAGLAHLVDRRAARAPVVLAVSPGGGGIVLRGAW